MADEPGQKAMLYFLEVLMNSNGPLTISQLAGRFGSRNFTADMRSASGGNEVGLKKFMLKYPSLFTVKGNMVSLCDGKSTGDSETAGDNSLSSSARILPDITNEIQAVQYFQTRLAKKEERWVLIKSLAGHLSQAVPEIRNCVGPQLEFKNWLLRHPHIFDVQGELVGLRDGIEAVATPAIPPRRFMTMDTPPPSPGLKQTMFIPPKTPPPSRKMPPKTPPMLRRSHSFSEKRVQSIQAQALVGQEQLPAALVPPSTPGSRRRGAPVTMTANEYKAVMFIKDIIEKRGAMRLHNITGHFSQAAEGVRNTIGWTKGELEEFLRKNGNVFHISEDEVVSVIKNAKLNVIITGSRPQGQSVRVLSGRKGKVFHVAKLWGIIDLGKHEHVFFDKSIMTTPIDDLQKEYRTGETLYFNAVLAQKTSRAKWRATRVWREHEPEPSDNESELSSTDARIRGLSPSFSIEEEINAFLPQRDKDFYVIKSDTSGATYNDAAPSGAGVVPVWNFKNEEIKMPKDGANLSMVPESYQMSSSMLNDYTPPLPFGKAFVLPTEGGTAVNGMLEKRLMTPVPPVKRYAEASCQTVSTGDIIATQLYHEASENGH